MVHILIIDDSPTEIQTLSNILLGAGKGYKVSAAETGEEGLEEAKSLKPDLILMDVVLPKMNGFQATRKLLGAPETKNIPIIMVSTKDQQTDKMWGMRQGAKAYLVKPVNRSELLAAVEQALAS
jgi:twitching motility two-component system response regulator PilH